MSRKQDFFTYYESLTRDQKAELRNRIIERLRITEMTFYNWYKRRAVPRWHMAGVAEVVGVPEESLFPNKTQLPAFNETFAASAAPNISY